MDITQEAANMFKDYTKSPVYFYNLLDEYGIAMEASPTKKSVEAIDVEHRFFVSNKFTVLLP
jgi:hypothetical protein